MMRAIGLMSGTSLDGVDVALIETDGETVRVVEGHNGYPRTARARPATAAIPTRSGRCCAQASMDAEGRQPPASDRPGCLPEAEAFVTAAHAEAVERVPRRATG